MKPEKRPKRALLATPRSTRSLRRVAVGRMSKAERLQKLQAFLLADWRRPARYSTSRARWPRRFSRAVSINAPMVVPSFAARCRILSWRSASKRKVIFFRLESRLVPRADFFMLATDSIKTGTRTQATPGTGSPHVATWCGRLHQPAATVPASGSAGH
jgi:hypothetical protein